MTLGPLTNVALAIRKHPEAMRKLRHITIMGGAHPYHNPHTVCAEFNIMVDPEAAQIVFSFGVPITLVVTGLDVAGFHQYLLDWVAL